MSDYNDIRWLRLRSKVLDDNDHTCQVCYETGYMHAHHIRYPKGKKIWEAKPKDLMCLCSRCHNRITNSINLARENTGILLSITNDYIDTGDYTAMDAMVIAVSAFMKIANLGTQDPLVSDDEMKLADLVSKFLRGISDMYSKEED